jgi:hypothetical protein
MFNKKSVYRKTRWTHRAKRGVFLLMLLFAIVVAGFFVLVQ